MVKLDKEYLVKLKEENKKVYASQLILEKRNNKFFSYSTNIEVISLEEDTEFYSVIFNNSSNYYFIGKESTSEINNIKVRMDNEEVKTLVKDVLSDGVIDADDIAAIKALLAGTAASEN